jgi:hypothetical protein
MNDLTGLITQLNTVHIPSIGQAGHKPFFISSFDLGTQPTRSRHKVKHLNKTQMVMPTHDVGIEAFNIIGRPRRPKQRLRHRPLSMSFTRPISPMESISASRPSSSRNYKNPLIKVGTPTRTYCHYTKKCS